MGKKTGCVSALNTVYRNVRKTGELYRDMLSQAQSFNKYYARLTGGKEQVATLVVFYAHQIEKGLSHLSFRIGFGKDPLRNLSCAMTRMRELDDEYVSSDAYRMALGALHEYMERNACSVEAMEYLSCTFPQEVLKEAKAATDGFGGSLEIERESIGEGLFTRVIQGRHSIREFSGAPVTREELEIALDEAMRSPSACNRQPTRVRVLLDSDRIEKALRIQGGFGGYDLPPALLLITADYRCFVGPQERNEGFIDAGMFAMTLLYALEDQNLAACPLNTMMHKREEMATRSLLEVPEWETLVMYIAVGHFPRTVKTCQSRRLSASDITTFL